MNDQIGDGQGAADGAPLLKQFDGAHAFHGRQVARPRLYHDPRNIGAECANAPGQTQRDDVGLQGDIEIGRAGGGWSHMKLQPARVERLDAARIASFVARLDVLDVYGKAAERRAGHLDIAGPCALHCGEHCILDPGCRRVAIAQFLRAPQIDDEVAQIVREQRNFGRLSLP